MKQAPEGTCICDLRRVPKVGSLTGRMTISLLEANTVLFNPESTVPTSCTGCCAVSGERQADALHVADKGAYKDSTRLPYLPERWSPKLS